MSRRIQKPALDIVYEDEHLIVINKEAGLLSVPIPKSNAPNALDQVKSFLKQKKQFALTVHRIDRYTSGLIVFAKTRSARKVLVDDFLQHRPQRLYHAFVHGQPKKMEDKLRHFMRRTKQSFRNVVVKPGSPGAAPAEMRFKVKQSWKDASLLEVTLITGFKNQIRSQLAYIGCPIIGDIQYGNKEDQALIARQALHAAELSLRHPITGANLSFKAAYPLDLKKLMKHLSIS